MDLMSLVDRPHAPTADRVTALFPQILTRYGVRLHVREYAEDHFANDDWCVAERMESARMLEAWAAGNADIGPEARDALREAQRLRTLPPCLRPRIVR